jgi:hypothetical protein
VYAGTGGGCETKVAAGEDSAKGDGEAEACEVLESAGERGTYNGSGGGAPPFIAAGLGVVGEDEGEVSNDARKCATLCAWVGGVELPSVVAKG